MGESQGGRARRGLSTPLLVLVGAGVGAVAAVLRPHPAAAAVAQDWAPFVLVAGLLVIGVLADDDRLFAAVGERLARAAHHSATLFVGAAAVVGVVTALLNLDTSVAFLTPVLIYTARARDEQGDAYLYASLLLANAASLFLPGSNLTNLIVLGHLHLDGRHFLAETWAPALAGFVATAAVLGVLERRALRHRGGAATAGRRPHLGVGLASVTAAAALVIALRAPALPVAAVAVGAAAVRTVTDRSLWRRAVAAVGVPSLIGLFGVAVALGTLGRVWHGPATFVGHLDSVGCAAVAAVAAVLVNNLPAASLLAARTPSHPIALLVGLDFGPNLFLTGSLAWLLWLRAARRAGARPSLARACRLGATTVPVAIATALGALALSGAH
ncbi:MAG TPA: SLC13 family permease [Acidimicrobiales bacterium]|nr:SLC13 family permease [Acidimicrobiales bacterium]